MCLFSMLKISIHYMPKMKSVLVLAIVLLTAITVKAQRDVIITQADEEIRCRILDETPTRFIYAYVGKKGKVLRNEIFKNLVKDFKYNMYESDLAVIEERKSGKSRSKKKSAEASSAEVVNQSAKMEKSDLPDQGQVKTDPIASETPVHAEEKVNLANETIAKERNAPVEAEVRPAAVQAEKVPSDSRETKRPKVSKETQKDEIAKVDKPSTPKKVIESETAQLPESKPAEKALVVKPEAIKTEEPNELKEPDKKNEVAAAPLTSEFKNYLKWRVGAKAGIGNIRDNNFVANNAFGLYQEKLMKGWTFGADLAFFPMEGFGFGVVYTDFKSSNAESDLNFINQMTGAEVSGSTSNTISRKFIGPALFFRKSIDYKTFVVLGGGPGMYLYSDKGDYNGAMFDYRGQQWGAAATLGLDFLLGNDIIGRDIILSLEAGYNYGRLNELDFGDGSGPNILNNPIVMDRLDFSIGLRFMRFPKYLKSTDN